MLLKYFICKVKQGQLLSAYNNNILLLFLLFLDKLLLPILIFLIFNFKGQNPLNKAYKGLPDGDKVDYYSNMQVRTMCTIKNGNVVGKHINYFKNGNLRSLEVFDNGLFNGTNFTLNKNGDTIVVEKYVHDTLLY